jgi:hypothetical protein
MKNLLAILSLLLLVGCTLPLKPGASTLVMPDGQVVKVVQSQNPKNDTVQDYKRVTDPNGATTEEVHTKIGAAQKDVAREVAAKLGSLRPVMWVGILVFLFGAASAVWPPLKVLVGGSVTTSAVIAAAGLAMIVLPVVVVGHEVLILAVAAGAGALWFFAHRHGHLRGQVNELLKEK